MPLTTTNVSWGNAGPEPPRKRALLTERDVCKLATSCMEEITMDLEEHDRLDTVERALERFKGVPRLSVEADYGTAHLLGATGLLPRMQKLDLWGSSGGECDEVARLLQGATRLTSIRIGNVEMDEGPRLAANCLALQKLELITKSCPLSSHLDFRLLSGLRDLQSLSVWDYGNSEDWSSVTCLTGLTELYFHAGQGVSLRPLAHLPRLISLHISAVGKGSLPEDFVLSCLAEECRGKLKSLKLWSFGSATAEAVRHLALCTSLVCLEICNFDNLPRLDDVEPMLEGLPHLKECLWNEVEWECD